ncbi:hypothetical protein G6F22_015499 [Rhizopus arrhizus]|nr:hypothetical protein G6F22_015499 [Rhizopus arrhizus]
MLAGVAPFLPVLQRHEEHGRVRAAAVQAEAIDRIHELDRFVVQHVAFDFLHQRHRVALRRALRQDDHGHEAALVFGGQERGGQAHEQERHRGDDGQIGQSEAHRPGQHARHAGGVALGQAGEGAVEPAEEAALLVVAGRHGLEQGGAERRRQRQRQERGKRDRHRQRHGELAVDVAHRAVEEGHRHEHRHQHDGNAHDGAADLAHGAHGGVVGRQAFLGHDATMPNMVSTLMEKPSHSITPSVPSRPQAPAPKAISTTAAKLSWRSMPTGKACMPPGSQRPTRNMAPSAPSQAVKAKFTGRNTVCHKGRERSTMTSAPV